MKQTFSTAMWRHVLSSKVPRCQDLFKAYGVSCIVLHSACPVHKSRISRRVLGTCSHQLLQENGQADVGRARVAAISIVVLFLCRLYSASASTQSSHSCNALTAPHHWPLQLDISSLNLVPRCTPRGQSQTCTLLSIMYLADKYYYCLSSEIHPDKRVPLATHTQKKLPHLVVDDRVQHLPATWNDLAIYQQKRNSTLI